MGIPIQWPLVLFTVISGLGAGAFVVACVNEFFNLKNDRLQFRVSVVAMILMVVGGLCSMLHLASPQNVMAAVANLGSFSGISVELLLLGVTFIVVLVFAIVIKRVGSGVATKVIGVFGIISALMLLFFCGHGYIMESRPAWNTNWLPMAYLGSGLAAGAFLYACMQAFDKEPGTFKGTKLCLLVSGILCAATCAGYALFLGTSAGAASPVIYWGGVILCGVVGALVLGCFAFLKFDEKNAKMLAVIGLVVLFLAALAVRVLMWQTGDGFLELFSYAAGGGVTVWVP